MNNCGSIILLSSKFTDSNIQPLYKFNKPSFDKLNITLPIIYDENQNEFIITENKGILLNDKIIDNLPQKLNNGDIISYDSYKFRINLWDMEEKISFDSFWYENLYLGNLPVFSAKAFEKLMEVEIQKAKRYKFPFSILIFRFNDDIDARCKEIEKIICENIRFTDMLSKYSNHEYLLYLYQVKKENISKIIEKISKLLTQMLDLNISYSNGMEYDENLSSFIEILINLYASK